MAQVENEAAARLVRVFIDTLSSDREVIKHAEGTLAAASRDPNYAITVLQVVAADGIDEGVRLAAAVNFKNLVKYRWSPTDQAQYAGARAIDDAEKAQVRGALPGLMLRTPPRVRAQLSEALSIISATDFPAKWPALLPELVQRLSGTEDLGVIVGVADTANSIFKRYRDQYSSNELVAELAESQAAFAAPALAALTALAARLPALAGDPPRLSLALTGARLLVRIFYSLNSPGLTPLIEGQLDGWMGAFHTLLSYEPPPGLQPQDDDQEGPSDAAKAAVCSALDSFMEKNEEEFEKYLQAFVTDVWGLLVKVSQRTAQDNLAMASIRFLTAVARSVHARLFMEPGVLAQVCEAIVIPNLRVRPEDEETFEMNPVEYIRRDLEGGDSDTRRRAAADLVRALSERFPEQVTPLFTGYVGAMLQEYAASPSTAWQAKDCAVFLVTALTVRGATGERGATATNALVNVGDFYTQQVAPELGRPSSTPILTADALKFVTTFRSQLPKEAALALLPNLISLLGSEHYVVHSYAAIAIERFLALKEGGVPRFTPADVAPFAQRLLGSLFEAFKHPESSENEYVMRCVMRLVSFLGPGIAPVAQQCLQALSAQLLAVATNPRTPGFNHYLFESVAALIKGAAAADPNMVRVLEDTLFPPFNVVLQQDVQEFHPYVFQIFGQLIELSPPGALNPAYMALFPALLSPTLWERSGNVPALTRLMRAYLDRAGEQVAAAGQLPPLLGVFQKLVASKAHDHEGLALLGSLVASLPLPAYQAYLPTVWGLLFARLQGSRTPKFTRCLNAFVALFVAKAGPAPAASSMDAVQPGVFFMLLQQVFLPYLASSEGSEEDSVALVATTRLLTESAELWAQARPLWEALRDALGKKLAGEAAASLAGLDGDEGDDFESVAGYSAAYARLVHATSQERPPLREVPDARRYAQERLTAFLAQHPHQQPIGQQQKPGGG